MTDPHDVLAAWRSAAWSADMSAWLDAVVRDAGAEPTAPMVLHRVSFWSALVSVETTRGRLWAKENHPGQAFEGPVTLVLTRLVGDRIVPPAAVSGARMATWDAGPVLSAEGDPDVGTLVGLVSEFADLQRLVEAHGDDLVGAGLPEFPASGVPGYVVEQVAGCRALPEHHPFHLTPDAAGRLLAGIDRARDAADALAGVPIPPSVEHNDLYGANCFRATAGPHGFRFFDFGDAVWTHPFGVLAIPLRVARSAGLPDADLHRLVDAYVEHWSDLATMAELRRLVPAAVRLAGAQRYETYRRQLAGVGPEEFAGWATSALGWLATTTDPDR
ncbi:MAG TPA: hypothetical protein VFN73_13875 [Propionibacteriaceae bacterium]|nr:hypothetical protein [Propionibacteriaceae bacterium]